MATQFAVIVFYLFLHQLTLFVRMYVYMCVYGSQGSRECAATMLLCILMCILRVLFFACTFKIDPSSLAVPAGAARSYYIIICNYTSVFARISKSPAYSICTIIPTCIFRQAQQPTVIGASADTPPFSSGCWSVSSTVSIRSSFLRNYAINISGILENDSAHITNWKFLFNGV